MSNRPRDLDDPFGLGDDDENKELDPNASLKEIASDILTKYDKKTKRVTIDDTHIRRTYHIDRNLDARLSKLAKGKKQGFKTMVVNKALEAFLNQIE